MKLNGEFIFNGLREGTFSIREESEVDCPEVLQCWKVDLPEGVTAGTFFLEVEGFSTRGFSVLVARPEDVTPPQVVQSTVEEGGTVEPNEVLSLVFSEILDQLSEVLVLADGEKLDGVVQRFVNRDDGTTAIRIRPPPEGFPTDAELRLVVGADVRDLSGIAADPVFEVSFTATADGG